MCISALWGQFLFPSSHCFLHSPSSSSITVGGVVGWWQHPLDHIEVLEALSHTWASLVVQLVKNLPAMWEMGVWPLGWEDPIEKGKATHSRILAWRIPRGSQRVRHFLSPSFTFGGQKSLMAVTFLVYWYGRRFISHIWSTQLYPERNWIFRKISQNFVFFCVELQLYL